MHILLVEDEQKTVAYLQKGLVENGYTVDVATNGRDGLRMADSGHYDLIILDVMLPQMNGWEVVEQVRGNNNKTPILFLTARDAVHDRVKGLQLGADDYLVKPFSFSELLARLQSLLRRGQTVQIESLDMADLHIDLFSHKVTRGKRRIELTPKEFALLSLLLRNVGKPLSRTFISEQVWDINFENDTNVVDVAVRRLRRKMDEDFPKKLIHTVRGVGYVIEERD